MKIKILLGSPVKQDTEVLAEFLQSIKELDLTGLLLDYLFIDDSDSVSSELLNSFTLTGSEVTRVNATAVLGSILPNRDYVNHNWDAGLIERVGKLKNHIIDAALKGDYTHLFLVDSDIVMHPQTLCRLVADKKDIVANIFWTKFTKWHEFLPQVWLMDQRSLYDPRDPKTKSKIYRTIKSAEFVESLKEPGLYRVGGLGACTLISRAVMEAGVNFSALYNLSFWGEDRFFCIRAAAAGFELYVDSRYPAYHIYRKCDLEGVNSYKRDGFNFSGQEKLTLKERCKKAAGWLKIKARFLIYRFSFRIKYRSCLSRYFAGKLKKQSGRTGETPRITLSMIVKDESKNDYLRKMLTDCRKYIDSAVIIDDASADNTAELCAEYLQGIPVKIVRNEKSLFAEEHKLRKLQWKETVGTNPDWILSLDADEVFEKRFAAEVKSLLASNDETDVYRFRLFDMWSETHFREDSLWSGHTRYDAYLVRYIPGFEYVFSGRNHHCGRLPRNLKYLKASDSELRLKHFGWAEEVRRREKYERYMKIDGDGVYGDVAQYKSVLDENPNLIEFIE